MTIGDSVTVEQNTTIGNNCKIRPGVVISVMVFHTSDMNIISNSKDFPYIGGVKIGDNVEVSSKCSIARGSLSDTMIGNDTQFDALVHVAHNVEIGQNCVLTAGPIEGVAQKLVMLVGAD